MARIPLQLQPGVVADDTDFSNGGWADASGVRFRSPSPGKLALPEIVGGFEKLSTTALTGVCRTIFEWSDGDNLKNFVFGLHNGLTVWQAGELADITPSSGFTAGQINGSGGSGYGTAGYGQAPYGEPSTDDYYALTWSFGTRSFGELYANPRGQGIFKWDNDTGTPAALLADSPAQCNFLSVAFTDQVMAFGCTDVGGQFNASCIRISDTEDPTEWTPGTANNAQQYYLSGNSRIVGARPIGRYYHVWTANQLHFGTYSTGWDFEPVSTGCGLAGPNAAVVVDGVSYWISPDLQFWVCPLGGQPTVLKCPIRTDFVENAAIGQNDKIVASYIAEVGEICFDYADKRDGYEVSRRLQYSVQEGVWSRTNTNPRTAFVGASPNPVGTSYEGTIYWHERGKSADGGPLPAMLKTGGQYMDPAERVMLLRGMWPDFRDQTGPIWLTIYSRFYPQDAPVEHGPFTIAPGVDKVDFLVTGRIFEFEFTSNSAPSSWRMGKPSFDAQVVGQR